MAGRGQEIMSGGERKWANSLVDIDKHWQAGTEPQHGHLLLLLVRLER